MADKGITLTGLVLETAEEDRAVHVTVHAGGDVVVTLSAWRDDNGLMPPIADELRECTEGELVAFAVRAYVNKHGRIKWAPVERLDV